MDQTNNYIQTNVDTDSVISSNKPNQDSIVQYSQGGAIVKNNSLTQAGEIIKKLKFKHIELSKELNTIVENETTIEKKQLEDAIERYNNKIKVVTNTPEFKNKLEKRQEYGDRIEDILDKVKVAYRKAIRMIKDQAENEEDMINKINNLDNQVQDALLTEDEKAVLNVIRTQVDRLPYRNIRMLM